jgi:hypothetical protein
MSEGETEDAEAYQRMRGLICREVDVHELLALSWCPRADLWLYLIKTPFATWPKYVVGYTDTDNENPEVLFRCGSEWAARAAYDEQNEGDHL